MANSPALPAGFEVESVGKPLDMSGLPEGFEVESIPEEESLLTRTGRAVKGVLDIPEKITKEVILPFSENIATQAVGGAGAVLAPAVAGRNYLTTLMATGDLEKAYESAKSGARETGEFFGGLAERIPTTELGKKSSEYVAKGFNYLLEPVGGIAKEAIRVPLQSLEAVGLPKAIARPIEDITQVGAEFGAFGLGMKGGGIVKSQLRNILAERKGMPPAVPTAAQFREAEMRPQAQELSTLERAKAEFQKPEVKNEYEAFLDDVEAKGRAGEEGMLEDLAKREEARTERKAWEEYERFPDVPEGFEVEYIPKAEIGEQPGSASIEKPFSDLRPDARRQQGEVEKVDAGADAESRANAALEASRTTPSPQSAKGVFGKLGDKLKSEAGSVITAERKPFYSKLEEFVNKDMKLSLPIDSARKMAYNKGVTVDEWNDVFGHLRGKVTKGQLLDELAVHGRKFEDVILGEKGDNLTPAQRIKAADNPAQFEEYSEPGYKPGSYREMFVTAPGKLKYSFDLHNRIASELNKIDISPENKLYKQQRQDILNKYGMTLKQWHEFKKFGWQDGHSAYSNIGNPIVRIRFNEREVNDPRAFDEAAQDSFGKSFSQLTEKEKASLTDVIPKKKKVLFVEEIQGPSEANQAKMPESLRSRIYDIGVKRVVSYAKENGFDEIAWTNGKMQTDRYSLEKHLDEVRASVLGDGYKIGLTDKKGNTYNYEESVSAKELPEYVGKTLAKRIIEEAPLNPDGVTFTGLDLKVGGEGLKRLYDEIIPGLMKKYGGEKIGKIDLQLEPTVTSQRLKIPGAGPQETIVSSLPLTDRAPSSFTMYSDPLGFQASTKVLGKVVEGAREGWEQVLERNPKIAKLDEKARNRIEEIYRGIKEGTLDPERVMREDPYAHEVIKNLFDAEESKNAFMQKVMPAFIEATRGIKNGSDSSMRIGKVLDGQAGVETLTAKERKAFEFFKSNYDWMIHEYARNAAGSEAAYQKILSLVNNKQAKRSRIKDLSPEDKVAYDRLRQAARDIKGDKKVFELDPAKREAYERASQEARDFLHNDFTKNLPEGEKAAYDILSRKLTDYLPHLFDKTDLKLMFEQDIAKLKGKLEKTTKKELITKYKNQIAELEKALSGLEGGKWINFRDLPRDVFFRFFQERKGAKGYSFDAVKAFESYVYGIARKIYDEPALRKSYELYEKVSPELKPYTKELVNHYMGYGERSRFDNFARFVTTYEWIRTLGLNPRSALVNLTQRLNTAVWVGEKYAVQAQKMMFTDKAKADALFDKSGVAREIPQVLMEGPVAPSLQGLRSITGVLFDMVERGNRQHAFLSGYLKAKAKGMAEDLAIKEGIKVVHKTQFRYGKLGMAKWTRGPGGKLALQFLSYPMKQAQFLYDLYKKDRLAFLRFAAYTIGGNLTLQELFDTDMSNAVGFGISFGEMLKAIQFASEGDARGAVRHFGQAFTPGGGLLPSGPGPAASAVIDIGKAVKQGKGTEQTIKELTPVMWDRLKQAYQGIKNREGQEYPIYDDKGHMKYRLNARQLAQRTIGPRSEKERKESLEVREERNLEQERMEITRDIASKFAEGVLNDDEALIDEAAELITKYNIDIESKQLKNEIAARITTKKERTKPGKKETYQLLREGEMLRDKYEEEED